MKLKFGMPAGQPLVVAYWHPHHINLKKLLQFLAMKADLAIHQLATGAPWID
jgi:ABC-type proline/glycine betaine transport system substrate-binding protein